jgi:hypothetical protein
MKGNCDHPPAPLAFFFLSSTSSILSSGITGYFSNKNSSISSLTSPCTTISSPPLGTFVTEAPVANFLPRSFATFLFSSEKASRPVTVVTNFLWCINQHTSPLSHLKGCTLFRSTRLMMTLLLAMVCANFASAASALSAFLWASFSARFCASTDKLEVAAARASARKYC